MMNNLYNRVTGTLLIAAAILGLFFSMIGIAGTWTVKDRVASGIVSGMNLAVDSLNSTGQGLILIQQSFSEINSSIASVQDTLITSINTIDTSKPLLASLEILLDTDLPNTVTAVQTSLDTAYDSAKIIDTVLRALTIFNKDSYNPDVPLHEALAQISSNLDNLPPTLAAMETSMANTADQVDIIQADLSTVAANIERIETSFQEYEQQLSDYQDSLKATRKQVNTIKVRVPALVTAAAWVLTIFLVWMAIAQLGLLTQGWELLHRDEPTSTSPATREETQLPENPVTEQEKPE